MDYIGHNYSEWDRLSPRLKEEFKKGELRNYSSIYKFKCVKCGNKVSSITCNFYKWELDKVKCYSCQDNNK